MVKVNAAHQRCHPWLKKYTKKWSPPLQPALCSPGREKLPKLPLAAESAWKRVLAEVAWILVTSFLQSPTLWQTCVDMNKQPQVRKSKLTRACRRRLLEVWVICQWLTKEVETCLRRTRHQWTKGKGLWGVSWKRRLKGRPEDYGLLLLTKERSWEVSHFYAWEYIPGSDPRPGACNSHTKRRSQPFSE